MKQCKIFIKRAGKNDVEQMARLVTDELGTCSFDKNSTRKTCSKETIQALNLADINLTYKNYYVATLGQKVVGICGISPVKTTFPIEYRLGKNFPYHEILYFVVSRDYQRMGIGSNLLGRVVEEVRGEGVPIIYEAWGDGEYVNSKFVLEKFGFKPLSNLGDDYYRANGYCAYCKNRHKNCKSCHAELWIKHFSQD